MDTDFTQYLTETRPSSKLYQGVLKANSLLSKQMFVLFSLDCNGLTFRVELLSGMCFSKAEQQPKKKKK